MDNYDKLKTLSFVETVKVLSNFAIPCNSRPCYYEHDCFLGACHKKYGKCDRESIIEFLADEYEPVIEDVEDEEK